MTYEFYDSEEEEPWYIYKEYKDKLSRVQNVETKSRSASRWFWPSAGRARLANVPVAEFSSLCWRCMTTAPRLLRSTVRSCAPTLHHTTYLTSLFIHPSPENVSHFILLVFTSPFPIRSCISHIGCIRCIYSLHGATLGIGKLSLLPFCPTRPSPLPSATSHLPQADVAHVSTDSPT